MPPTSYTSVSSDSPPPSPTASHKAVSNTPTQRATLLDAARTIQLSDFTTFYQKPCARESLLTGIGAGFAVGGLRFITLIGKADPATATSAGGQKVWKSATAANTTTSAPASASASVSASAPTGANAAKAPSAPLSQARTLAFGTRIWKSMTWAVLSFSLFSAGAHLYCQRKRAMEASAMARAAEIVARKRDEKRAEKRAEMLRLRDERESQREARRLEHEVQKGSWSRLGKWFGGDGENGKGKG